MKKLPLILIALAILFTGQTFARQTIWSHSLVENQGLSSLNSGLFDWWTFDGSSFSTTTLVTGVALDYGSNLNIASTSNISTTTFYIPGKFGQAIKADGTSFMRTARPGPTGNAARTVSAWIRTTDTARATTNQTTIFSWGKQGAGLAYQFVTNDDFGTATNHNGLGVDNAGGAIIYSAPRLFNGRWHFVAASNALGDSVGASKVYLDGVLLTVTTGTAATTTLFNTDTSAVQIGAHLAGRKFKGGIDDVRIYNRQLSDAEIVKLYNLGTGFLWKKTSTTKMRIH